jgi:hypothetical protein
MSPPLPALPEKALTKPLVFNLNQLLLGNSHLMGLITLTFVGPEFSTQQTNSTTRF